MRTLEINKNDSGQRLDSFLQKKFKSLPKPLMYKYIRKKCIKINDKKCEINQRLKEGDIIKLFIKDEFFESSEKPDYDFLKAPLSLNIIYEDKNIMLLDKKPGLLVHPDENYHFDSLIARIQHYLYEKNEYDPKDENSFVPSLVNRIDRNTGGIVIAAKNAESLRILNEKMKTRQLKKEYLCVAFGIFKKKEALLLDYLEKNESKNQVFVLNHPTESSKIIKTKYKVLAEKNNLSLLNIELLTGRTHQIRAHLSSIGHPLVGDGKYGKNTNDKNRSLGIKWQCLYSYKLTFDFSDDAGILNYLNKKTFKSGKPWFIDELGFNNY